MLTTAGSTRLIPPPFPSAPVFVVALADGASSELLLFGRLLLLLVERVSVGVGAGEADGSSGPAWKRRDESCEKGYYYYLTVLPFGVFKCQIARIWRWKKLFTLAVASHGNWHTIGIP